MTLEFFLPMVPPRVTAQQHEIRVLNGKPVVYDTVEISAAKEKFASRLGSHTPVTPLTGPVRLTTKWLWPCEGTRHHDGEWKVTKPDTDNVVKAFKDVMERLGYFEKSDAQVASEITEKFWAHVPGIYVRLEELS
jgi:Holliday junction resolvase RusA-like endonuclease